MSEKRAEAVYAIDLDQTVVLLMSQLWIYKQGLEIPDEKLSPQDIEEILRLESVLDPGRPTRTFTKNQSGQYLLLGREDLVFNPEDFEPVRQNARLAVKDLGLMSSANEGLEILTPAILGYFTVRPPETYTDTVISLQNHSLPKPTEVTICKDPKDKIEKIFETVLQQNGNDISQIPNIILIDDGAQKLIEDSETLEDPAHREIIKQGKFIIAAFGHTPEMVSKITSGQTFLSTGLSVVQLESGLRVAALPDWQAVEHLQEFASTI